MRFIWVKVFDGNTNIIFIILRLHGFLYILRSSGGNLFELLTLIGIKSLTLKTIKLTVQIVITTHLHRPNLGQRNMTLLLLFAMVVLMGLFKKQCKVS